MPHIKNLVVEIYKGQSVSDRSFEIVERKGTGHPDTICDSVMEAISVALSQAYMKEFGTVLHHNIDKGLMAAGSVYRKFGGGRVIRPIKLFIGDRATFKAAGKIIPVPEIAIEAANKWLKDNLRYVEPEKHIKYNVVLAPGSEELADIFSRPGKIRAANDTSATVGYYPLSPTENVVFKLERYLNSRKFKNKFPETGEDIKIMGLRRGKKLDLTVAMPLISSFITSEKEYFQKKEIILREMADFCLKLEDFRSVDIYYNYLDMKGRGLGGIYLSLLGTSAEDADSGQVGRGNRVNGIISINRPIGSEAAAGKNPVSHVGKIYNILSHKIAKAIYDNIEGIKEVYVMLLSRIGSPVDSPQMATAQVLLEKGREINEITKKAEQIIEKNFSEIHQFCMELSRGKYPVC